MKSGFCHANSIKVLKYKSEIKHLTFHKVIVSDFCVYLLLHIKRIMRTENSIIKKCLVVLLTTVYLFIAVTYLLYLPKFSPLRTTSNYVQEKSQLLIKTSHRVKNAGANVLVLILRAYKSTIENKREMFGKLFQIGVAFVFIIAGGALLHQLMSFMARVIKSHRSQQHAYLSYHILRI